LYTNRGSVQKLIYNLVFLIENSELKELKKRKRIEILGLIVSAIIVH